MAKIQVIEQHFKDSVERLSNTYIEKIQVNEHGFTATSADYRIQTEKYEVLVECKQVSLKNRATKPMFNINRLTQEYKLNEFNNRFKKNKSYLFLVFWAYSKKSSMAYLIPFDAWIRFRKIYTKSTISLEDINSYFEPYICDINGKYWAIDFD